LLNEIGQRRIVGANDDELVFSGYRLNLLHGNVFQEQNLTLMKALDALVGIAKDENVSVRADTLQNAPRGCLVNAYGVAGQRKVGNRPWEFPKVTEWPGSRDARRRRRRRALLGTAD
jgi:hypothetical protein